MTSVGSFRSDGDRWDLASSVGATATMVAASRAFASQGPDPLLDDQFAEPLVRAVGQDFFTRLMDGEIFPKSGGSTFFDMQQTREQITVRTRFFDDFLLTAVTSGIRQAVILAAGLDARAYRLPWPQGTVVFEVDKPEVVDFKTTTLQRLSAEPTAVRRAVGVDLRDDWPAALRENGFDTTQPTAWIAEGLLVYLPPEAQDRLFDHIAALSAPGSRLATEDFLDHGVFSDGRSNVWRDGWHEVGFDFDVAALLWGGERRQVSDHLGSLGWRVDVASSDELYAVNGFELPDSAWAGAFRDTHFVGAELLP